MENSADESEWILNLDFINKFELLDLDSIKKTHLVVTEQERMTTNLHLVMAYHRGLIYLTARKFSPTDAIVKQWFPQEFNVAYATIQRYIAFTTIIKTYPRLLFCGLTFSQFSSHHNRIKEHLITDNELANRLKLEFNMSVHNKCLDITPVNVPTFPATKLPFAVNPDHVFEDDTDVNPERPILDDKAITEFYKHCAEAEEGRTNLSDDLLDMDINLEPSSPIAGTSRMIL